LEAKIEGQPRRLDGTDHPVEVYFRDYRPVDGLQIPYVLETRVLPVAHTALGLKDTPVPPEKTFIDKVVVNPKLDEIALLEAGNRNRIECPLVGLRRRFYRSLRRSKDKLDRPVIL